MNCLYVIKNTNVRGICRKLSFAIAYCQGLKRNVQNGVSLGKLMSTNQQLTLLPGRSRGTLLLTCASTSVCAGTYRNVDNEYLMKCLKLYLISINPTNKINFYTSKVLVIYLIPVTNLYLCVHLMFISYPKFEY